MYPVYSTSDRMVEQKGREMNETVKARPLGSRVILRMREIEGVTPGGVVLPRAGDALDTRGTVIAVGPAVKELKLGDEVVIPPWQGPATIIKVEGKEYIVIFEQDILVVLG